jgi:hypothetical protein
MVEIKARLENTCMQKPLPYTDKTIMFSEHEVFKVELRIAFKLKTCPQISLLITKLSISQTYIYARYFIIRNISLTLM